MKLLILSTVLILFFTGCGGEPKPTIEVKPKAIPAWFINPPQATSSTLFGVGEGKTKQEAITNALSEILSTLSVSIESQFTKDTRVTRTNGVESYTQNGEEKIKSTVKELRISNYEILNYEKLGFNSYAVLLKADKNSIFNSIKDETDKSLKLLKDEERSIKSATVLEQLKFYKEASQSVDGLVYRSVIMKVLNPSFKSDYIINDVSHFKNSFIKMKSNISFNINSDNESKNLIPVVKDAITSNSLKIANMKNRYHLNVNISSNIIYASSYGFDLARSSIEISIKDHNQQIISVKKLNIIGQSTQGYSVAKQNIAYQLKDLIEQNGIQTIFDIEL